MAVRGAQAPLAPGSKKAGGSPAKLASARPAVQPNLARIVGYAEDAPSGTAGWDEEDPFSLDSSDDEDAVLDRWAAEECGQ